MGIGGGDAGEWRRLGKGGRVPVDDRGGGGPSAMAGGGLGASDRDRTPGWQNAVPDSASARALIGSSHNGMLSMASFAPDLDHETPHATLFLPH